MTKYIVSVLLLSAASAPVCAQPVYSLSREVRIGTVDGPGALTRVDHIAVAPDGTLFVAQPQDREIAVFASDGSFLRRFGRRGSGPGEFQVLGDLTFLNDTLWAVDTRRLVGFTTDGRPAAVLTWTQGAAWPAGFFTDGSMHAAYSGVPPIRADGAWAVLRYNRSGMLQDTLAILQSTSGPPPFSVGGLNMIRPVLDGGLFTAWPDRNTVAIVDRRHRLDETRQAVFSVFWISLAGDTLVRRSYRYQPRLVDEDFISRRADALLSRTRFANDAGVRRELERELGRVKHWPPITAAVPGTDGSLWLVRDQVPGEPHRVYRIAPDGSLHGQLHLPPGARLLAASREHVWLRERGYMDVEAVVRYRWRDSQDEQSRPPTAGSLTAGCT